MGIEKITHYGRPSDPFVRMVDRPVYCACGCGCIVSIDRTVLSRALVEKVALNCEFVNTGVCGLLTGSSRSS